jgi:lipopolysaccharide/colanic/teichoic acid biosynthesis glycosyltransferase
VKRAFDIVAAGLGLLLLAPLLLLFSAAIRLDSPGPVFYRGVRIGRGGRPFRICKFRSMVENAESLGASSTGSSDARVTRVGRFLRRYKLDELPQLFNVLKGDMSIVGPRPQVEWAVRRFSEEERKVLELRPGLTDWATIRFHNEEEIIGSSGIPDADEAYMKLIHPEKMRLQLKYLEERSFLTDLRIILETFRVLFRTRSNFGGKTVPGK